MSIKPVSKSIQLEPHHKVDVVAKLKVLRRATRAVMQRYEGEQNLSGDESAIYDHLTLSMVVLNTVSDHLAKSDTLHKTWDRFALGSDFDLRLIPLLQQNGQDELWVEYFECRQPKDFLVLIAGETAEQPVEVAPVIRPRKVRARHASSVTMPSQEATRKKIMQMIRQRILAGDAAVDKTDHS
ncbi:MULTISPECIES: hypothetical protein [unclassified Yoonia]|uniref:hypothetical protein n=1 Tax=unclassified Yoonia TaxID=2629118 RepID=UPI002AFF587E|nr:MULTISPECIES: hypothetical protein [unclassified Yoonia]